MTLSIKIKYYVKIVADDFERLEKVKNVYAVDANSDQAVQEIAECDIMATSVGVNALPYIVDNIAKGIRMRMSMGSKPMDIILSKPD